MQRIDEKEFGITTRLTPEMRVYGQDTQHRDKYSFSVRIDGSVYSGVAAQQGAIGSIFSGETVGDSLRQTFNVRANGRELARIFTPGSVSEGNGLSQPLRVTQLKVVNF
jgi:hypothetical protein